MKLKTYQRKFEAGNTGLAKAARRGEAAFSLPEILMAVLVIGTVMMAMFAALSSGFTICGQARENLRATQIMMRKIEGVRLCNWGQLTNNITFVESYDPVGASSGTVYSGVISTNSADAIPNVAEYRDSMRLVTVTVNWTTHDKGRAFTHQRQMQTFVARNGLQKYVYGR